MRIIGAATKRFIRQSITALLSGLLLFSYAGESLYCQAQAPVKHDSLLTIRFFDVGQGDAILISTPEGKQILIDGGRDSRVVQYLVEAGVDTVDLVIASHGHADHIVGLEALFQSPLGVRLFIDNGTAVPTKAFRDLHEAARVARVPYRPARDTTFRLGSVRLQIITSPLIGAASENNESVILRVDYGALSALFPGDAQVEEISALIARGMAPVTVLKAAHHGSRNGLTPGWLAILKPKVVVISVGRDNRYGHPDPMALRYYGVGGRRVLRTDLNGTVTIGGDSLGRFTAQTAVPTNPRSAPPK